MVEELYPDLHIFISHSHKNNVFGHQLYDDLGYFFGRKNCLWYDSRGGIRGGHDWWPEIKKNLERSNKVIAILSRESLRGKKWVVQEINLIWPRKVAGQVTIIPIQCDNFKYRGHIDLKSLQTIFCCSVEEYQQSFQDIIQALNLPGDPIAEFIRREEEHIMLAFSVNDMDAVIRGTRFLIAYFPEAASETIYWRRAIALATKRELQQARVALQEVLKLVTDTQQYYDCIKTYLNFLLKKDLLTEALDFTKELHSTSPYPNYIAVRYKQLQELHLQRKQHIDNTFTTTSSAVTSSRNDRGQSSTQATTRKGTEVETDTITSSQFAQTSSTFSHDNTQQPSVSIEEKDTDEISILSPIQTDLVAAMQDVDALSWWQRFRLFLERSQHHPHPKEIFGTPSFISAAVLDVIFLLVIILSIPVPLLFIPFLVFLFTIMLVGGRCIPFGVRGFLCLIGLAVGWAMSGYLLVGDVTKVTAFSFTSSTLIEALRWLAFVFFILWGGLWHWELFKQ